MALRMIFLTTKSRTKACRTYVSMLALRRPVTLRIPGWSGNRAQHWSRFLEARREESRAFASAQPVDVV